MRHVALVVAVTACGTTSTPQDWGPGLGTPDNPVPNDESPYLIASQIDVTIEQIVPAQIEAVVATLRQFSTNPARALITLAERIGVPEASTIYSILPSPLRGKFEGFINSEIAKAEINGTPITEYASDFAELFERALTKVELASRLTITGHTADHTLTALDLRPGVDYVQPIGGVASDVLTQHPELTVVEGGAISLSHQHFGFGYGEYAWQALDGFSRRAFGNDIKTVFENAVNCGGLAHTIANKCVLGVCVGHEREITAVCRGGVGAIVDSVHSELAKHRIEALRLAAGSAVMVDDDGDGLADRLIDGSWQAELNLGLGLRHTNASFQGTR